MQVKPASPPNGSELLVINKDGKTLYVTRPQVAAILAYTGVRSRPMPSVLTERTGTEVYRAIQGGILVEFTLTELSAYLAGTATPDAHPPGRGLSVYSGTERFVGRQGTGVFASDILQTLYVRGLGGSLAGLGGDTPDGGGGGNPVVYPLDAIGGAPAALARGTRRLTASYSGPALRVVRASDSAQLDIGFIGERLDEATLDAFRGSQPAKILTQYDISGNGQHVTQSNPALQASIGSITIGGHRAILNIGAYYPLPAGLTLQKQSLHVLSVQEFNASNGLSAISQFGTSPNQLSIFQQQGAQIQGNGAGVNLNDRSQTRATLMELASSAANTYLGNDFASATGAAQTDVAMVGGFVGNTALAAGYEEKDYQTAYIVYPRRLSTTEATTARQVLRDTFSMSQTAPTKRVIFDGDSITIASVNADRYGYAKMAQRLLPNTVAAYNYAGGGNQLNTNILSNYAANVGATLSAYPSDVRIVALAAGTNDLTVGGRTAAQIYADIQTYAGQVRSGGGKIVVTTILPNNTWNTTQQTTRTDLNTLIRNNWSSFADGLADHALDPTMGPQSAAANTALYSDGLHPTTLGHTYLAPITAAAISLLL